MSPLGEFYAEVCFAWNPHNGGCSWTYMKLQKIQPTNFFPHIPLNVLAVMSIVSKNTAPNVFQQGRVAPWSYPISFVPGVGALALVRIVPALSATHGYSIPRCATGDGPHPHVPQTSLTPWTP